MSSEEETKLLNKQFEERQIELQKSYQVPEAELIEDTINEKLKFGQQLSEQEVAFANKNLFVPTGYRISKNGLEAAPQQLPLL